MKTTKRIPSARLMTLPAAALLLIGNLCLNTFAADDPWQSLPKYQFGQSREPLANIEDQIRKGGLAERANIERRLLEVLQAPGTTKDSRRFICQWLGTVGSEQSVTPLAALLADPDLAHPARIALERLPFASVDKALIAALPKVKGDLLIGVVSSIGTRRSADAVPALATLLKEADPAVAKACLAALGQIGTEKANQALSSARLGAGLERDLANAQISAAFRLAESGKRADAAEVFRQLLDNKSQPVGIRAAAFQGLATTLPSKEAVTLVVSALESNDAFERSAAVKAFAGMREARDSVAERLPSLKSNGQLLLLGILADAPGVAARKPLLQVAQDATEPSVKAAAIECLAVHGHAGDVALVAKFAAAGEAPVKAAAKKTLQRMSGPGVDAAFIRLIESSDAGARKAGMEALPSRRMESALPTLIRLMQENDPVIAAEAARTLGQMGTARQIQDLAQVVGTTKNDQVRSSAQEAIKDICVRTEDKAACAAVIQEALQKASTPEARIGLLPVTVYTGGEAGLAQVLKALGDGDEKVREVAFRTFVAWPEGRAGTSLLRFAATAKEPNQAIVALRDGCLRLAELEEVSAEERASILKGVMDVAKRTEEKRRAVTLMGQVPSVRLLEVLPGLAAEESLRTEAVSSTVQLARSLAAVYPRQSLAALEKLKTAATTPELQKKVEDGVKAVRNAGQSPEGYILGWMVSGPYTAADKDGTGLFDVSFAPEQTGGKAEWRPVSAPVDGRVNLGGLMPGDNRVAYLRSTITSEQDQTATLELGTDDGVKVWLNGEVVHGNNTVRACAPAQDKPSVRLKKGDNVLLLKVTQGGGEWAAMARLIGPDGKPLSNTMIGAGKE